MTNINLEHGAHLIRSTDYHPVCGAAPFQRLGVTSWERFVQLKFHCPICLAIVKRTYTKERIEVYFGISL